MLWPVNSSTNAPCGNSGSFLNCSQLAAGFFLTFLLTVALAHTNFLAIENYYLFNHGIYFCFSSGLLRQIKLLGVYLVYNFLVHLFINRLRLESSCIRKRSIWNYCKLCNICIQSFVVVVRNSKNVLPNETAWNLQFNKKKKIVSPVQQLFSFILWHSSRITPESFWQFICVVINTHTFWVFIFRIFSSSVDWSFKCLLETKSKIKTPASLKTQNQIHMILLVSAFLSLPSYCNGSQHPY